MPEDETESYEIIPVTPLKKLEKRIEQVEQSGTVPQLQTLINQIIELIRSNQKIVNDVIQANSELRNEISKLPNKIDELLESMKEFMDLLKTSSAEETVSDISKDMMEPLVRKMDELIQQNKQNVEVNQAALTSLGIIDKRLKRLGPSAESAPTQFQRRY